MHTWKCGGFNNSLTLTPKAVKFDLAVIFIIFSSYAMFLKRPV
jgi:hypothetical protein